MCSYGSQVITTVSVTKFSCSLTRFSALPAGLISNDYVLVILFFNNVSSGSPIISQGLHCAYLNYKSHILSSATYVQGWYIVLDDHFVSDTLQFLYKCNCCTCMPFIEAMYEGFSFRVYWSYGCQELLLRLFSQMLENALVPLLLISGYQWTVKHYCQHQHTTADIIWHWW